MAITKVSPGLLDLDSGITITTADNSDNLTIISTDADATTGPNVNFYRNSGSPADNDHLGEIRFTGRNDNSQDVVYSNIETRIKDASDGTEDGYFDFETMLNGTLQSRLLMNDVATVVNEDSLDLDFRVESDNLTHAFFVQGSDGFIGIGDDAPLDMLHLKGADPSIRLEDTSGDAFAKIEADSADEGSLRLQADPGNSGANSIIRFDTDGTEKMRMFSDGQLFLGTGTKIATETGVGVFGIHNTGNNRAVIQMQCENAQSTGVYAQSAYYNGSALATLEQHTGDGATDSGLIKWFTTATGGSTTERMRLLSGGGLTFNGDSAQANALDDYEEGTATLTMSAITAAPTIAQGNTFTINYTKIGNLVRFVGYTGARNITNVGTGGAKFTGLPFAQAGSYYGHVTFAHSTAFASDVAVGYIEAGGTFFYPITLSSTSAANYQTGTRYVMVQGVYHTA